MAMFGSDWNDDSEDKSIGPMHTWNEEDSEDSEDSEILEVEFEEDDF